MERRTFLGLLATSSLALVAGIGAKKDSEAYFVFLKEEKGQYLIFDQDFEPIPIKGQIGLSQAIECPDLPENPEEIDETKVYASILHQPIVSADGREWPMAGSTSLYRHEATKEKLMAIFQNEKREIWPKKIG